MARDAERVMGWAALSPVSVRYSCGEVAEISVYVAASSRGQLLRVWWDVMLMERRSRSVG
ncbi:MAG TPA: hypothetical protein QGI62_08630 [Anaerolineales bacterium]|nr:hypothetical protein [Anaerolineales bacterium]